MIDLYYWPTPNGWKVSIMNIDTWQYEMSRNGELVAERDCRCSD